MNIPKRLVSLLPLRYQNWLRRLYYARRIRSGKFISREPEIAILTQLIAKGDWVIDIGANIGLYTTAFSAAVGETGRVFALEPIPDTFGLLASNSALFPIQNVTLLNMAASDACRVVGMNVPKWDHGLNNYINPHVTNDRGDRQIVCCNLDSFCFPQRISLIKIDVEGHEMPVLNGMVKLIAKDHPHLIVEASSEQIIGFLADFGYTYERLAGSPNYLFRNKQVCPCKEPVRPERSA
jgi:FkbM family methyltransferase